MLWGLRRAETEAAGPGRHRRPHSGGRSFIPPTWNNERSLTRLDGVGGRVDTPIAYDARIEMIGRAGTVYLRTASGTQALNVTTMSPMWSALPEWTLIAARPDGGAAAQNTAGELGQFNETGELAGPTPIGLENPVPEFGSWIGNTPSGLTAIASDFYDATQWDATFISLGYGIPIPRGIGSRARDSALWPVKFRTNYSAVRILTDTSPDVIFNEYVRTFSGVTAGDQATVEVPNGIVTAVGQRVTFTLTVAMAVFQGPFAVETVRFDPANRTMAVKTVLEGNIFDPLPGHPLEGWRFWRVSQVSLGQVLVETGAVDRPAPGPATILWPVTTFVNYVNYLLFDFLQTEIWNQYLTHVVDELGGITTSPSYLRRGTWDDPVFNRTYIMNHVCGQPPTPQGFCP